MMYTIRSLHYSHRAAYGYEWNGASLTQEAYQVFKTNKTDFGDTRLEKSFYYGKMIALDGTEILDDDKHPIFYFPEEVKLDLSSSAFEKTAGARWAKYEIDKGAIAKGQLQHNDYELYR